MASEDLETLERRVARELALTSYPAADWVPARLGPDGRPAVDVVIVGGGQGGLTIAHGLLRRRVTRLRIVDESEPGLEGPWLTYARMPTLRSPKEVTGPDLDLPSLTFQAWYEARLGADAWSDLGKIDRRDWAAYLGWLRRVLRLPVENRTRFVGVSAGADGLLAVDLERLPSGERERVYARHLVLANGIEASGRWWTPPVVEALPATRRAHTSDAIDFPVLAGRRVAVLGAGASAFDNAATALEAGAASVTVCCRRPELQRVQPFKWLSFPGFLGHFADLDDAWRWRFMNHLLSLREAFPKETWERVSRHPNFRLMTGAPWESCVEVDGGLRIDTPRGPLDADFVIVGTGLDIDLGCRPELAEIAGTAALWRDRYTPPEGQENPRLGRYPYLGPGFEFLEKRPGSAPWIGRVRLFTFGTTVSFGPSGASINAMKFAVPRLVSGIVRDLFLEDVEAHWESLSGYDLPEFLLPGEDGATAPARAVVDRLEDGGYR